VITNLGSQRYDLLEILIRLFCDRLFEAVHRGLTRRYIASEDDLPVLRGRLDLIRQFTINAGQPQNLASRYEELSPNIPLNQIMKSAVARLRCIARAAGNQRRLFELELAFAEVGAVSSSQLPWNEVVLDRTNRAWADLLTLAQLLLGDRFQTTSSGSNAGFSLLFEMNTLFEEFVGRSLRAALLRNSTHVRLQRMKGHALIDADGKGRFATQPDIVVEALDHDDWIIDTKWKRLKGIDDRKYGVAQSDVYQMMAYSQVHHCKRVMLLYPHHNGIHQEPGRIADFNVSGTNDTKLVIATLDLSDVSSVPAQLRRLLDHKSESVSARVA
jgi:5-methylcytosine-specific restriction enzyme subunit McrC